MEEALDLSFDRLLMMMKRRKAIRPVFPDTVPVVWILKSSASVPRKIRFRPPNVSNFLSHKNTTFLTVQVNTLTFPRWKKTTTGVKTATNGKEFQKKMKMCRLFITQPGQRLRRMGNACLEKHQ